MNKRSREIIKIISVVELENPIQNHLAIKLSEEYKSMIDTMLEEEISGKVEYVSLDEIKNCFYKA